MILINGTDSFADSLGHVLAAIRKCYQHRKFSRASGNVSTDPLSD